MLMLRRSAVERKIDELHAIFQDSHDLPFLTTAAARGLASADPLATVPESSRSPVTLGSNSPDLVNSSTKMPDIIDRNILRAYKANMLLDLYRSQSRNFPFVLLPQDVPLSTLRHSRPYLLLTVLAMASSEDIHVQGALEAEYRELLARKVVIEGDKSLDLLQSLLVYLAWYHFYFKPHRQQIYQLAQLAVAMAEDLGLGKLYGTTKPVAGHDLNGASSTIEFEHLQSRSTLEAKRTYVGCYYLSSCLSIAFRKPNGMSYTSAIDRYCQDLASAKEAPLDPSLHYLIRVQHLAEDVGNVFGDWNSSQSIISGSTRTQTATRALHAQLEQLRVSMPTSISSMMCIEMACHATLIHVYEVCLHMKEETPRMDYGPQILANLSWRSADIRIDLLIGCLEAAKKCLDFFTSLTPQEIQSCTIIEFTKLIYAVMVFEKLTTSVELEGSDILAQEATTLSFYLDLLIQRMSGITTTEASEGAKDVYWHFKLVFQRTKSWYRQRVQHRDITFGTVEPTEGSNTQDLSPLNLLDKLDTRTPPDEEMPGYQSSAFSDDFWDQLLPGWPTSLEAPGLL
ncbi:hypothetical protein MMC18_003635 [Xylographa bjoerkii]|nr:hypothetical protein [Xylographa bjoerkii]